MACSLHNASPLRTGSNQWDENNLALSKRVFYRQSDNRREIRWSPSYSLGRETAGPSVAALVRPMESSLDRRSDNPLLRPTAGISLWPIQFPYPKTNGWLSCAGCYKNTTISINQVPRKKTHQILTVTGQVEIWDIVLTLTDGQPTAHGIELTWLNQSLKRCLQRSPTVAS